jgi:hypothetical protein
MTTIYHARSRGEPGLMRVLLLRAYRVLKQTQIVEHADGLVVFTTSDEREIVRLYEFLTCGDWGDWLSCARQRSQP